MKFVKYLAFSIASIAAVLGMIYLERETSVVRTVKVTLGLDVAQDYPSEEEQVGVFEMAEMLLSGAGDFKQIQGMMSTRSVPDARSFLPEQQNGWMREDRMMSQHDIKAFEDSFFPDRAQSGPEDANKVTAMQIRESVARGDSRGTSGAFYYREDMKMLITVSNPNAGVGVVSSTLSKSQAASSSDYVELGGQFFAVERQGARGFGKVTIPTIDDRLVSVTGNTPAKVMQLYLAAMQIEVPEQAGAGDSGDFLALIPAPLQGWDGEARVVSYDDVLAFDAVYAPDGRKKEMVSEEYGYLNEALENGMQIAGVVLTKDDKKLLLTLTRLPDVRRQNNPFGGAGVLIGAGLMQLTYTFETTIEGVVMLDDMRLPVTRSVEGSYVSISRSIGGAYVFDLRGNASDSDLAAYAAALDLEAVKEAAKLWNPDWDI